jgi:hypothetical protein
MSLDGFVADPEGKLDWMFGFAGLSAADIRAITASIGAALAGRHRQVTEASAQLS